MVLPICKACLDSGSNIVVRAARQNAMAKHARMEVDSDREALRAEVLAADEAREVATATTTSEEVQTLPKKEAQHTVYPEHVCSILRVIVHMHASVLAMY